MIELKIKSGQRFRIGKWEFWIEENCYLDPKFYGEWYVVFNNLDRGLTRNSYRQKDLQRFLKLTRAVKVK